MNADTGLASLALGMLLGPSAIDGSARTAVEVTVDADAPAGTTFTVIALFGPGSPGDGQTVVEYKPLFGHGPYVRTTTDLQIDLSFELEVCTTDIEPAPRVTIE